MGYEALGVNPDGVKGSRWKDRAGEQGRPDCWTVASGFGLGRGVLKVTIILGDGQNNTFWTKHVLRRGESPDTIHAVRNTRAALTEAMDHGTEREQKIAGMRYTAAQNSGFTRGAGTSTFIKLDAIDLKMMLYHMAHKLASVSDRFDTDGDNVDVDIELGTACVVDYPGHGKPSDSIIVGARKIADDGTQLTFDVNHCANNSDNYL